MGAGYRVVHGEDCFGLRTEMALRLAREEAVYQAMKLWHLVGELSPTQRNEVDRTQLVSEWTPDIGIWRDGCWCHRGGSSLQTMIKFG